MRQFVPILVCATLCVTSMFAQQPQAPSGQPAVTFKAEVDYVDVDTIVTDQQGRFISDFKKDDFEIFEDGKAQKIEMFSYVNLPLDRPDRLVYAGHPVASDVKTNQQSLAGRLYVVVLDDLDTSLFRTITVSRGAHRVIVEHIGANTLDVWGYSSG